MPGFAPHGWCYQWQPPLIGLHVVSDALIALAYFSIGITLTRLLLKRRDLPFRALLGLGATFIVLCGFTHVMSIVTVWQPAYWADGVVKALTALVSVTAAIVAAPAMPRLLRLPNPLIDPVTKVATRTALFEMLRSGKVSRSSSVLYVDLDGFKDVNDRYGHACGDLVLHEAARRLSSAVGERGTVARLGGDEFAVVLPDLDLAGGASVARDARDALLRTISVQDGAIHLGASFGVARLGADFEAALRAADAAMYAAKHDGGAGVAIAAP